MEDLTIAWIEDEHEYKMLLRGSACTDVHIATSLSAAHVALQQVAREVTLACKLPSKDSMNVTSPSYSVHDFKFNCYWGGAKLPFHVNLATLASDMTLPTVPHIDQAKYQPVSYTVKEPRVKLMVHHTGSITIMGAEEEIHMQQAMTLAYAGLLKHARFRSAGHVAAEAERAAAQATAKVAAKEAKAALAAEKAAAKEAKTAAAAAAMATKAAQLPMSRKRAAGAPACAPAANAKRAAPYSAVCRPVVSLLTQYTQYTPVMQHTPLQQQYTHAKQAGSGVQHAHQVHVRPTAEYTSAVQYAPPDLPAQAPMQYIHSMQMQAQMQYSTGHQTTALQGYSSCQQSCSSSLQLATVSPADSLYHSSSPAAATSQLQQQQLLICNPAVQRQVLPVLDLSAPAAQAAARASFVGSRISSSGSRQLQAGASGQDAAAKDTQAPAAGQQLSLQCSGSCSLSNFSLGSLGLYGDVDVDSSEKQHPNEGEAKQPANVNQPFAQKAVEVPVLEDGYFADAAWECSEAEIAEYRFMDALLGLPMSMDEGMYQSNLNDAELDGFIPAERMALPTDFQL